MKRAPVLVLLWVGLLVGLGVRGASADTDLFERAPVPGPAGCPTLVHDPANVVGRELLGSWVPHRELDEAFVASAVGVPLRSLRFERDRTAERQALSHLRRWAAALSGPAAVELGDAVRRVYLAGRCHVTWNGGEATQAFALVTLRGNPTLFLFGEDQGRSTRTDAFTVMAAADVHGHRDPGLPAARGPALRPTAPAGPRLSARGQSSLTRGPGRPPVRHERQARATTSGQYCRTYAGLSLSDNAGCRWLTFAASVR